MTNEEEKGERRVLDLDKISGEGKTLKEIIESGEEIPEELKETMQAFAKAVEPVVERSRAQMAELARTIGAWGHAESAKLGAELAELVRIMEPYQKTLDSFYGDLAESVAGISSGRFTGADVRTVVGGQYKALELQSEIIAILEKMLEEERKAWVKAEKAERARERRILILTAIGWLIAIIAIVLQVVT